MTPPITADLNKERYCLVLPPKGAHSFNFKQQDATLILEWWNNEALGATYDYIPLPPGRWSIIGLGKDVSDDIWRQMIEYTKERASYMNHSLGHYQSGGWKIFYKNYQLPEPSICVPNTATQSGYTWLKSLNADENYLILKYEA